MYSLYAEGKDVSIVTYTEEYIKNNLNITSNDIKQYGPPMAIKYKDCDIVVPIPTKKSMKLTSKELLSLEKKRTGKKDKFNLSYDVSDRLAKEFFN